MKDKRIGCGCSPVHCMWPACLTPEEEDELLKEIEEDFKP